MTHFEILKETGRRSRKPEEEGEEKEETEEEEASGVTKLVDTFSDPIQKIR